MANRHEMANSYFEVLCLVLYREISAQSVNISENLSDINTKSTIMVHTITP